MRRLLGQCGLGTAQQQVEHGHPHGDAVGDLLDDHRAGRVGDVGGDLHAAVHRAGVHHDRVVGQRAPSGGRRGRSAGCTRGRSGRTPPFIRSRCTRSIITASALASTLSRSYDVSTGQVSTPTGSSVGGATRVTSAPSVCSSSALERATRLCSTSPTIVTRRPSSVAEVPPHREGVQQRLGGVLVGAVAGVDHARPDPAASGPAGAARRGAVPDDDRVGAHRLQGQRGVLEALALGHARALGGEVDHVGATAAWRPPRTRSGSGWSPRRRG